MILLIIISLVTCLGAATMYFRDSPLYIYIVLLDSVRHVDVEYFPLWQTNQPRIEWSANLLFSRNAVQ